MSKTHNRPAAPTGCPAAQWNVYHQLRNQAVAHYRSSNEHIITPDMFVDWLSTTKAATVSKATLRTYKASCARAMRAEGNDLQDAALLAAAHRLSWKKTTIARNASRTTFDQSSSNDDDLRTQEDLAPISVTTYARKYEMLLEQCRKSLDIQDAGDVSPIDFVNWLIASKRPEVSPKTFRGYRAASIMSLRMDAAEQKHPAYIEAISRLEDTRYTQVQERLKDNERVRIRRAKTVTQPYLKALVSRLNSSRSEWHMRAATMLVASLISGCRPEEWEFAKLVVINDKSLLRVQNGKNTHGRGIVMAPDEIQGLPPDCYTTEQNIRYVPVEDLAGEEGVQVIARFLTMRDNYLENDGRPWAIFHEQAANAISRARKPIKPRNPGGEVALYTARHQFSANMKQRYSPASVAYLMGHASPETAQEHYGKKRSGWSGNQLQVSDTLFDRLASN